MSKFFRTKVTFEVLSEEPIEELDVEDIAREAISGDLVASHLEFQRSEMTPQEAANALLEFGSEPGFFCLDAEGKEIEP